MADVDIDNVFLLASLILSLSIIFSTLSITYLSYRVDSIEGYITRTNNPDKLGKCSFFDIDCQLLAQKYCQDEQHNIVQDLTVKKGEDQFGRAVYTCLFTCGAFGGGGGGSSTCTETVKGPVEKPSYCGDGTCDGLKNEDCYNCPNDCGVCPDNPLK